MSDLYYTPEISDLFVGYEGEITDCCEEKWRKLTISKNYLRKAISIIENHFPKRIRTPYLTKEQIEKEGWKEIHYREYIREVGNRTIHFSNGQKESEEDTEYVSIIKMHNSTSTLFEGECPSINEFRKICKWLGI